MAWDSEIAAVAEAMTGTPAKPELLELMASVAGQELENRLLPGVAPESCREAFIVGAGFLAAAMYLAAQDKGGVSSFKAGDFSATVSGTSGESLRQQAERIMAPYLAGSFAFVSVEG